jgi:hypothetical protein
LFPSHHCRKMNEASLNLIAILLWDLLSIVAFEHQSVNSSDILA